MVVSDKEVYKVRDKAEVSVRVRRADGKPCRLARKWRWRPSMRLAWN
jgi:hypothetical protein